MAVEIQSNKAKIAKRVIEVLEFFDDRHREATVMDIVRRYDRPQSSTSELLSSMVELGLLYKDPYSRSYIPTPRAAMLGTAAQPDYVRDGRLTGMIDRVAAQTGLAVGLFGMVGLKAQIFNWRSGNRELRTANGHGFGGGQTEQLSDSAVGQLLLSTVEIRRREAVVRRLNAEASESRKFVFADMCETLSQCQRQGHIIGRAGFGSLADACAVLLPAEIDAHPLAIGLIYEPSDLVDPVNLLACLTDAVDACLRQTQGSAEIILPQFNVA